MVLDKEKTISEIVKNYAQVAAWAAAFFYFCIKLYQGYFVVDMTVSADAERHTSPDTSWDHLAASITLKKGDRGSFRFHDARLILTQGSTRQESKLTFDRFSFRKKDGLLNLNLDKISKRVPTLNLAAGETAKLGTLLVVRSDQPCLIEVVVMGTGFGSIVVGQWRTSVVSLPLTEQTRSPLS